MPGTTQLLIVSVVVDRVQYLANVTGLRYTGVWNAAATQTIDVEKALLSGIQKRAPTFEKL
jgi:hypothetical protein